MRRLYRRNAWVVVSRNEDEQLPSGDIEGRSLESQGQALDRDGDVRENRVQAGGLNKSHFFIFSAERISGNKIHEGPFIIFASGLLEQMAGASLF